MPSLRRLANCAHAALHAATGWFAYRIGFLPSSRRRYERVLQLRGACYGAYVHLGRIAFDEGDYAGWRREFEHARRTDPQRFSRLRHPLELFEPRLAGTRFANERAALGDAGFDGADARATWHALRPANRDARSGETHELPLAPDYDPMATDRDRSKDAEHADEADVLYGDPLYGSDASADPFACQDADARGGAEPTSQPPASAAPDASFTGDDFSSASERRRFQLRRPIDHRDIARCDFEDLVRRLSS